MMSEADLYRTVFKFNLEVNYYPEDLSIKDETATIYPVTALLNVKWD